MTRQHVINSIEKRFGDCIAEFDSYGEVLSVEYITSDEMPDYLYDEIAFFVLDLLPGNIGDYGESHWGPGIIFHLNEPVEATY